MKTLPRILVPLFAGAALGAGGLLATQALAPPASPPPRAVADPPLLPPPPPAPAVEAPPPPALERFGLPCRTADAAAPKPEPTVRYVPMAGKCVAGFDATSTLHDFRGWTPAVTGEIRFEPGRLEETATAVVRVDARTLDTGDAGRDAEMHREHLQSAAHPEFLFTLTRFRRADPSRNSGAFLLGGTLEIHGKSVPIEAPGTFELRSDGLLHAKGEFGARMTQFGITPPATALVIRVGDDIKIWFELWARPERDTR